MKQLYLLLFTLFAACLFGCLEEPEMDTSLQNAFAPELEKFTRANVDITATTVVARATVKKENGDPVTERGFIYWLKNTDKVETVNETNLENGKGEFSQKIEKLQNDTIYYISPYARNKKGITYGDTLDINTKPGIGSVVTSEVTDVTATTAVVGGLIKDKGEGEIKMIGFNLYKNSELDSIIKIDMDEMPTDSTFIHTLTELEPETEYVIEAIVENSFGQFATDKQSFRTKDGHPVLGFLSEIETDYTFATVRAKLVKKGDGELESIGFCWGEEITQGFLPDIEKDSVVKCTVDEEGIFLATIPNLKARTRYIMRGFAVNAFGTVYTSDSLVIVAKSNVPTIFMDEASNYEMTSGNVTVSGVLQSDGKERVSQIVVYYSTAATPGPDKFDGKISLTRDELDANNKFKVSFNKLKGNKTYYVSAYATNESGTESSKIVSFTTPNIFSTNNLAAFIGEDRIGRTNYSLFTLDDQVFVLGGDVGNSRTNELYGYRASNNMWKQFESYEVEVMNMAVCTNENTAYVFGGNTLTQNITKCNSYKDNVWTPLAPLENGNVRNKAAAFYYNDYIYLVGGNINSIATDTICSYDIKNNKWDDFGNFIEPLSNGIALVFEDNVYIGLGDKLANRGFWKSNGSDFKTWEPLVEELPGKMGSVSTGVIYKRNIYVVDEFGVIWQFSIDDKEWYQRSTCSGKSRNFDIFVLNDTIYILGLDIYANDFMTYDPSWDN